VEVEYLNGTTKIGESTVAPFGFEWKNTVAGNYSITAVATDNEGLSAISPAVAITVTGQEGQLIYLEDFEDDLAQNWKTNSGVWSVDLKQYHHTSTDGIDIAVYEGTTFYNFTYDIKIKPEWGNIFGVVFNYVDSKNYYRLEMDADPKTIALIEVKNGIEKILASGTYTGGGQGTYSSIKVTNNGKVTSVDVNSKNIFNGVATTAFRYGKIGLYAWWQPVWYDNIEVKAESKGFPVGIETPVANNSKMKCFPNPLRNGSLTIELAQSEKNTRLEIYNLEGQCIYSEIKPETASFLVSANSFPVNGMYFIKLNSETHTHLSKIQRITD
jgi:hypothetical protein